MQTARDANEPGPPPNPGLTLIGALPGEHQLDQELLDRCAERVGQIYARKCLEATLEVGDELIRTFFQGDVDLFRTRARGHVTYRELCQHAGLRSCIGSMSRVFGVFLQVQEMDESLARRISVAHHNLLLPVRSTEDKNQLARRAVEEKLGKRQFAAIVRPIVDAQVSGARGGPAPKPELLKVVSATSKVMAAMPAMTSALLLPEVDPDEQLALAQEMERLAHQLNAMAGHIRGQVDHIRRRPTRW